MNWFILAVTASLFLAFYGILSKVLATNSKDVRSFSVLYYATASVICLLLILFEEDKTFVKSFSSNILILTIISALVWGVFGKLEFISRKYIEASVAAIVFKIAPVVTLFLSIIWLDEGIDLNKIVALILILAANVMIFYNTSKIKLNKGLILTVICAVFLGLGWTIDKVVADSYSLGFYSFIGFISPSLLNLFIPNIDSKNLIKEIKSVNWFLMFILAFANTLGYYLMIKAFILGEVSKVTLIISSADVITILMGIIFLKERKNIFLKIVAGLMVFIGTLLLS